MFGPWIETYTFIKGLLPTSLSLKRPHFNFITLHYCYIVGCTIIGSIIIYPAKNLSYTNSLFFAAGSATQSGLNPIDINTLYLYQQVTLMLIACIANPIFIHTFVVFVRLYWFEKRFQTVVLEAQKLRATRERSRAKTDLDEEKDVEGHGTENEHHLGNRKMLVIRPGERTMAKAESPSDEDGVETSNESESVQDSSDKGSKRPEEDSHHSTAIDDHDDDDKSGHELASPVGLSRDIKFADEPRPPRERRDSELMRLPNSRTADEHIKILEKQRNPENDDVLYIPGPRDFDRGDKPQTIQWANEEHPVARARSQTRVTDRLAAAANGDAVSTHNDTELNEDDHPVKDSASRKSAAISYSAAVYSRTKDRLRSRAPHRDSNDDAEKDQEMDPIRHRMTSHEALGRRGRTSTFQSFLATEDQEQTMPYLSYQATIGRNSMFVNLTEEQREELGGIEYRSLKLLAMVLCCYFVGFHVLGLLSFLPWMLNSGTYRRVVDADGVDPGWWGVFTPASMFNDLGFTLTPDSMTSFQYATWILLIGSFLIIIGNTGFPCMLRFIVWVLSKTVRTGSAAWEELRFLLDHPRRCFTLLFPGKATWWLFWVLVLLNGIDLIFFIILDLNDDTVTGLPPGIRVLDGWFQAASTRTAGFNVVSISDLHPAIQVSYLIMMYISVFPIAISVRRTNVYEERSLGIYTPDQEADDDSKGQSYVGAHLRRQLSFDLWFVFLGLFIISIVEGHRISNQEGPDYAFSLFAILFEIVSAYGTVGLSLGFPNTNASFSAQFRTISKLVIIAMQIRGRHRGLPYALDKAVLLPSENLHQKEAEEALRRASARRNTVTTVGADGEEVPERATRRDTVSTSASRGNSGYGFSRLLTQALSAGPTISKRRD